MDRDQLYHQHKSNACESRDFLRRTYSGVERRREYVRSVFYTDKISEGIFSYKLCSHGSILFSGMAWKVRVVAQYSEVFRNDDVARDDVVRDDVACDGMSYDDMRFERILKLF